MNRIIIRFLCVRLHFVPINRLRKSYCHCSVEVFIECSSHLPKVGFALLKPFQNVPMGLLSSSVYLTLTNKHMD